MDLKHSSYEFHVQIEPLSTFVRREWTSVGFFFGGFCVVMAIAVFAIDPAFFYPRLQTDPLNYYLKAKLLAEHGSTNARLAINAEPFAYAAMPGVLRAPMILLFNEFDYQIRAMQLLNIPIIGSVALMSAYILSWTQPARRHWLVIGFAFAFTALSPVWVNNILLPLADAPYAAFTLASLIVSIRLICSDKAADNRWFLVSIFVVLFIISFLIRFTAPVVLLFAATLALGRFRHSNISPRTRRRATWIASIALLALVILNRQAIFERYLYEPLWFLVFGDKPGMVFNLLAAAIPSQILPSFQLGFVHQPILGISGTTFASTPADAIWMLFGMLITTCVIVGIWRSRSRLLPEIVYVLAPLPVLMLMLPSTTRYLMSYQALFWIFFFTGIGHLGGRYSSRIPAFLKTRRTAIVVAVASLTLVLGLRLWKTAGTASRYDYAISLGGITTYVDDVSSTFRALRQYLDKLPSDSTLLIGSKGNVGRWKAIANRDYYDPDSLLGEVARRRNVYVLVECGTQDECQGWPAWKEQVEARVAEFGDFTFESVFAANSDRARTEVLRLRSVQ